MQHNQHFPFVEQLHVLKTQMHMHNSIPRGLFNDALIKMASNSRSNLCSRWDSLISQARLSHARDSLIFIVATWRYHLNTYKQELYYECDWNAGRFIVIASSTNKKNDLSGKYCHWMKILPVLLLAGSPLP